MILITSLKFFQKIPKGTCEETSLKLDKLVQFFGKIWFQKTIQDGELTYL